MNISYVFIDTIFFLYFKFLLLYLLVMIYNCASIEKSLHKITSEKFNLNYSMKIVYYTTYIDPHLIGSNLEHNNDLVFHKKHCEI